MLGLRLRCCEVKHQVLSCSCYARIVLRVALKEQTVWKSSARLGRREYTHIAIAANTPGRTEFDSYFSRNPELSLLGHLSV